MRDYELLLVIRPSLDNAAAVELSKQVGDLLKDNDSTITATNMWGRRKLAYPIDNQVEATYILLKCQIAPSRLRDIEFNLKLNESLLRYMIVRDHTPATTEVEAPPEAVAEDDASSAETTAETTESNDAEATTSEPESSDAATSEGDTPATEAAPVAEAEATNEETS